MLLSSRSHALEDTLFLQARVACKYGNTQFCTYDTQTDRIRYFRCTLRIVDSHHRSKPNHVLVCNGKSVFPFFGLAFVFRLQILFLPFFLLALQFAIIAGLLFCHFPACNLQTLCTALDICWKAWRCNRGWRRKKKERKICI